MGELLLSLQAPPAHDGFHGEAGGVEAVAHAHVAVVVVQVVDAVGDCLPQRVLREVVREDRLGLLAPGSPCVLKSPINSFFLVSTLTTGSPASKKSRFCCSI
jgi:hypothetical protein